MVPKTILIIEDLIDLADSLEDILTLKGYRTLKTLTGKEGLEAALHQKPDLILLDLRLPDMDGVELLKKLLTDTWGQTAKVLFLTASDFSSESAPELNIAEEDIIHKSRCGIKDIVSNIERKLNTNQDNTSD
ncbi:MAG: response regulator [Candidatus Nomurabacteria bacterium]|nr:MAG: response regulator [Candidatus Nomurabacteria bacterium]